MYQIFPFLRNPGFMSTSTYLSLLFVDIFCLLVFNTMGSNNLDLLPLKLSTPEYVWGHDEHVTGYFMKENWTAWPGDRDLFIAKFEKLLSLIKLKRFKICIRKVMRSYFRENGSVKAILWIRMNGKRGWRSSIYDVKCLFFLFRVVIPFGIFCVR